MDFAARVICVITVAVGMHSIALAKVSQDKASELGKKGTTLTPVGAERAGNSDGTIPPWTGGITNPPATYKVGMHFVDPFAGDKASFTITPGNYNLYIEKLSAGQTAMFKKYADFKMVIYPTRRSASFPEYIYRATLRNAVAGELTSDGEGVSAVAEGIPFPILDEDPRLAGMEAIWNHKLKYKGVGLKLSFNQANLTASGQYELIHLKEELDGPYYREGNTLKDINNVLLFLRQEVTSPPRLAGQVLLVHETLNATQAPRQAWIYNPGQRRVRRAPNVAYDNPGTASDGLRTNDMFDMFNGAMDRFNWKLLGKKEMYVPYNDYLAQSSDIKIENLLKPGHMNPDLLRYELHRVWIVEATRKSGERHINSRRTYYLDEDSWQILEADHYDEQGDLWRYSEVAPINYYQVPVLWVTDQADYDLKSGRYCISGLDNQEQPRDFSFSSSPEYFSPQSLRQSGIE
jgi:Protein of unknown function (DUF1329)